MNRPPMLMPVATAGIPSIRSLSSEWFSTQGINPITDGPQVYASLQDFANAPADESWVYRCVMLKAFFAQGVPLRVYVKRGKERIPAEDTTDGAALDLQGLLDDVNPVNMNGGDLKAYSTASTSVWGENYVRKVRGRLFGVKELWWLRAPDITPNLGRVWIDSYSYRDRRGTSEVYGTSDVIAWRTINLKDPTRGLSPLSAARFDIANNRLAAETSANLQANWSVPPGAWVIPQNAEFTPQDRGLVQRALRALKGPRGRGKVPILPQGLTWQSIALTPEDSQTVANRKLSRMAVCAALGVPLVLAGDDEKTSVYANLRDAERIFARYMITELDWIADGYNGWLVPDFDPATPGQRRLVVAFDYSQIEALQAPLEDRKRVALSEIEHGARTGDEYRADFRTGGPLPDGQGQIVTRLSTLMPISTGPAAPETEITQPPAEPDMTDAGSDTIRAYGRSLYRHPAVREFIADPSRGLDTALLFGRSIPDPARRQIEAGLRSRRSAVQIAETLEEVPA